MVVVMEISVGAVARIAGLGRPDPIADLEIAAERHHLGLTDGPSETGIAAQRGPIHHEMRHTRGVVADLHAGRVTAFGRPDPGRGVAPAQPGVGEPFGELELAQPGIEQRLERMRQRAAEQLDRLGVDQLPPHRCGAVAPVLFELRQRGRGQPVLMAAEGDIARHRGLVGAQLPITQPVMHPGQAVRIVELGGEHRRDAERQQV